MLWLIPVILSFDIIEALLPVIIILVLIAAAAGLTRGTDIFALFGLGAIMGFADSGKGRVGRGFKGTRYGGDAGKRSNAARHAKGGVLKTARKKKAELLKNKAKELAGSGVQKQEKLVNLLQAKRESLGKRGKGNSRLAKFYDTRIAKENSKLKTMRDSIAQHQDLTKKIVAGTAGAGLITMAGGSILLSKHRSKKAAKISEKQNRINAELGKKEAVLYPKMYRHFVNKTKYGLTDADFANLTGDQQREKLLKELKKTKGQGRITITSNSLVLGRKNLKSSKGYTRDISTGDKVLRVPASAYFQKGAASAAIVTAMHNRNIKNLEKASEDRDAAIRINKQSTIKAAEEKVKAAQAKVDKTNDRIARTYYHDVADSEEALKKAESRTLLSNAKKRQERIIGLDRLPSGVSQIAGFIGEHTNLGAYKVKKLPNETHSEYAERKKDLREINRLIETDKAHTIRHPFKGSHGVNALEEKKSENEAKAYLLASKIIEKNEKKGRKLGKGSTN